MWPRWAGAAGGSSVGAGCYDDLWAAPFDRLARGGLQGAEGADGAKGARGRRPADRQPVLASPPARRPRPRCGPSPPPRPERGLSRGVRRWGGSLPGRHLLLLPACLPQPQPALEQGGGQGLALGNGWMALLSTYLGHASSFRRTGWLPRVMVPRRGQEPGVRHGQAYAADGAGQACPVSSWAFRLTGPSDYRPALLPLSNDREVGCPR